MAWNVLLRGLFSCGEEDGGFLNLNEARAGSLFELGQESVDFLAGFNELDLDGQMVRDFEDVRGVKAMRGTESGDAFEDRGAIDAAVEEEVEDAGVDRDTVVLCTVAEVDGNFEGLA